MTVMFQNKKLEKQHSDLYQALLRQYGECVSSKDLNAAVSLAAVMNLLETVALANIHAGASSAATREALDGGHKAMMNHLLQCDETRH
jgi:hypothetical protein